ncbi:TerL protein [Bradyrhizobium sp. OAE829]|uniref:TerL protein n=1 Tax=Bradyrhizobium sp. OAE829 TaxID=2663807 RepID=UPI00178B79F9
MLDRTSQHVWPPDYKREMMARLARADILLESLESAAVGRAYYRTRPVEFIEHWCYTFDPRNAGTDRPTKIPFLLFPRQREFIEFLHACLRSETGGLIEKSRDMGATWLCVAFSAWLFLFERDATIGWGSRKAASVDQIGDMSSIFEKMRWLLRSMPPVFWPPGFDPNSTMSYMRIYSDHSSITGESGDDIGRGGRTLIYFKDESAHYEHPEAIEAALSDNTRVQIDISSVNGLGNVFHRKREAGVEWEPGRPAIRGKTNVFVMNWSDHPDKTQDWYEERRSLAVDAGLLHVFAQEVDRNYSASVEGVVIPAEWVRSAIDAHERLDFGDETKHACYGGLDVADGGGDRNAMAIREGVTLRSVEQWGERDTGITTRRALDAASAYARKGRRIKLQYDSVGVGAGVKAEANRLKDDGLMPKFVGLVSWNAGAAVLNPDKRVIAEDDESPLNKDFYGNLKAQAWWKLRLRFERTHRAVRDGVKYDQMELISLPSTLPLLRTLEKELSQPTMSKNSRMKLIIDKQPEGTRSPNLADAVVMAYWPVDELAYDTSFEWL